MTPLKDLAKVIRSKNAGPFELTFDVIFDDDLVYERVKDSGALNAATMAQIFNVPGQDIIVCMFFDPARAFKLTLRRGWEQGTIAERDTFGAQQYVPLLTMMIP
jgi:hypothetical protein